MYKVTKDYPYGVRVYSETVNSIYVKHLELDVRLSKGNIVVKESWEELLKPVVMPVSGKPGPPPIVEKISCPGDMFTTISTIAEQLYAIQQQKKALEEQYKDTIDEMNDIFK